TSQGEEANVGKAPACWHTGDEAAERRHVDIKDGNRFLVQPVGELNKALGTQSERQHHCPVQQGAENMTNRGAGAVREEETKAIFASDVEVTTLTPDITQHIAMILDDTFRLSCRAGGVENVGRRIWRYRKIGILGRDL